MAPDAPPITMFCGVSGLRMTVYTTAYPTNVANVSHIVSGLTQKYNKTEPATPSTAENSSVCTLDSSPLAVGRQAVRFILASMPCSTMQLKAAAAPATSHTPAQAKAISPSCEADGSPGTASTMPMRAQNTMSWTTRGLVSA
ncbi:hypothetical protein D3C72_1725850 [compost metagenome]